jgi:large subunit ribosomal protein L6
MSRIGKQPVAVPKGVTVEPGGERTLKVKGPKGELSFTWRSEVEVALESGRVAVTATSDTRAARAYHGMTRALIANMVEGVTSGYSKTLDVHGVGWNVSVSGRKVLLNVGFCHPVEFELPKGVEANCPSVTQIVISGADKQAVGQLAAAIRAARPPEPYKGKGVRYKDEQVKLKAGKSFGS